MRGLICTLAVTICLTTCLGEVEKPVIEFQTVAAKDVCAWPNLTELPDESIVASIFNQPGHGSLPGDVDCWATTDGGKTWQLRGTAAPRDNATSNRMNVAAGLATDGDMVVIASGYGEIGADKPFSERVLVAKVYRSWDGARSWIVTSDLPMAPDGAHLIPFGDITVANDGSMRVLCYTAWKTWATYMLTSRDEGRSWAEPVKIGEGVNEGAPLHLGEGKWIAVIRTVSPADCRLYTSDDDGATWTDRGPVTEASQHPAHLLKLKDGRVLMTYGNRRQERPGVEAKFSSDGGLTWTDPLRIQELPMVDLGYPASLELADGRVLTAYYAHSGPGYDGYHMGAVVWKLPEAQ